MSSLQECLKDKNPRDLDVFQIAEFFLQFEFVEGSDVYKLIQKSLLKNKLDGQAILDTAKGDLIEKFRLKETDDIYQFLKLRVALRKADFSKREKINLDEINVKTLSCDKVCQLLDEQIGAKDENQRLKWYSYIEDESIDGHVLLDTNIDDIKEDMELNKGQIRKFEALQLKMQGGNAQPKGTIDTTNINSTIGTQSNILGSAKISYGNINVGNTTK